MLLTQNNVDPKNEVRFLNKKAGPLAHSLLRDRWLYIMLLIPLAHIFIFNYIPMYGILVAFKDYNTYLGFLKSPWVGLKHFLTIVNDIQFWKVFFNTFRIGVLSFLFGFPAPIIFALLLNEIKHKKYKKTIQTMTYLPYFISVVAICGIIYAFTQPTTGIINVMIKALTGKSIYFLTEPGWFIPIYIITNIWQGLGFGAIIYLAALSGIDPGLYESAIIDGATRFQRVIYITLPSIKPTIIMLMILGIPGIISVNFEKILLLYRPIIYEVADVIPTYMYRKGLLGAEFSYGTAVGLFLSLISLFIIITSNALSKKFSEIGLW